MCSLQTHQEENGVQSVMLCLEKSYPTSVVPLLKIALKIHQINTGCCKQLPYHFLQFCEFFTLAINAHFLKLDKILYPFQSFRVLLHLILKHGERGEKFAIYFRICCIPLHLSIIYREVALPAALWRYWSVRSYWGVFPASLHLPWTPGLPAPGWPACFLPPRSHPVAQPSGSVEGASVCVIAPTATISQLLIQHVAF